MSISFIVCRGYGSFGGGTVELPTRGYGVGAPIVPPQKPTGLFFPPVFISAAPRNVDLERWNAVRRLAGLPPLKAPPKDAWATWFTIREEKFGARAVWDLLAEEMRPLSVGARGHIHRNALALLATLPSTGSLGVVAARASALVTVRGFVVDWWWYVEGFRKDAGLRRALQIEQEDELLLMGVDDE